MPICDFCDLSVVFVLVVLKLAHVFQVTVIRCTKPVASHFILSLKMYGCLSSQIFDYACFLILQQCPSQYEECKFASEGAHTMQSPHLWFT